MSAASGCANCSGQYQPSAKHLTHAPSAVSISTAWSVVCERSNHKSYFIASLPHPSIAAPLQVYSEPHAVQRTAAKPIDLFLIRHTYGAQFRWEHAFSQIIILGKVYPVGSREFARIPHVIQSYFVWGARPHLFRPGNLRIKCVGGKCTLCANTVLYRFADAILSGKPLSQPALSS